MYRVPFGSVRSGRNGHQSRFCRSKARRFRVSCECMPVHFEKPTLTAGADNASGTHRPSHYIRGVCQHEIGCELKAMSQWLDGQPELIGLVAGDLRRQGVRETGRRGLPAESVLRCALLKQQRQLSYEELAFHLEDSASFRAFARLPLAWSPKK